MIYKKVYCCGALIGYTALINFHLINETWDIITSPGTLNHPTKIAKFPIPSGSIVIVP